MSIDAVTLTRADVAWLVGMSDSWVRDRMQAGDLPRPGSTAEEYVEAFVAYRVRKYEIADEDGTLNKEQEQARLAKEQADAKAMDNAERRRELASLPDMLAAGAGVIVMIVAQLQQVGARVAHNDTKLRARIDAEINNVLMGLDGDEVAPQRVPDGGRVIVRTGDPGQPEVDLSPARYNFYPVEAVEIADSEDVWKATIDGKVLRATGDHRVYVGEWVMIRDLPGAARVAGTLQIVKITVTGAHTYVSNGILSHNIKAEQSLDPEA